MEKVRIQDDLFQAVNGDWIEKAVIPSDKPSTGGFQDLDEEVEKLLINEFNGMNEKGKWPNRHIENACRLFAAAKDTVRRNREGIRPVLKDLARIKKLNGIRGFNRSLKEFVLNGFPLPFDIQVETDMKDTDRHCVLIGGPHTILPDTTYYKSPQKDQMISLWTVMARTVMAKTRLSDEDRELYITDTLKFDEKIAALVKSSEEWSEYAKIYNPMKTRTVSSLLKPVRFRKLLNDLFGSVPETVIVAEPRYLKGFSDVFTEETVEEYKHWAYVTKLLAASGLLSEKLREAGGMFMRALTGVKEMRSAEKFAYRLASKTYAEPIGLYYGRKYFGEKAKNDVTEMVGEVIEQYKKRISANPILSDTTKKKAVLKLSAMSVNMGYPDKVRDLYKKLVYDTGDSLYDIVSSLFRICKEDSFSKLNEKVDRTLWAMPGHMVNACYDPFRNSITFPAAILQAPFYSIKQTRSQNLGGIGAVIGHEISHAFDNNGAKFDEKGNLHNWWTKEDNRNFARSTKAMIREFEGIELPWGKVNSTLIVSENIADNGGMAVTLDIMKGMKNSSYEEYFINWATIWRLKAKPEYQQLLLSIDVHAPAILRANMPPRNFTEWYDTFGATKKDGMYIAPSKRVVIW